ncbi:MAG: nicotinamidase [Longimicrobiales bacterium]
MAAHQDSALLIVDVQNDFCPGGALPVAGGDAVVPVLNRYIERFLAAGAPVFASRDWHPADTRHFRDRGGPWPAHCVQGTAGAAFHPELRLGDAVIITKGDDPGDHGYSAFEGHDPAGRTLAESLEKHDTRRLYVGGLATDYCVRASVLDAREAGFDVVLLGDAVRGIDVEPGDVARALDEMRAAGARTATRPEVEKEISAPG